LLSTQTGASSSQPLKKCESIVILDPESVALSGLSYGGMKILGPSQLANSAPTGEL
jgi:hypothetical protein